MTITVENPVTVVVPTGSSLGPFATLWSYELPEEIRVVVETDGVEAAPLALNTDFTVAATPREAGGYTANITLTTLGLPLGGWAADGASRRLLLRRATPYQQSEPFGQVDGFRPVVSERTWDRQARMHQEHRAVVARALLAPVGEAALALPPAALRADKVLAFDGDASPIALDAAGVLAGLASKARGSLVAVGGETTVTVSQPVAAGDEALVSLFIGGAEQEGQVDYVADGTAVLTLDEPLVAGAEVRWVHLGGSAGLTAATRPRQFGRGAAAIYRKPEDKAADWVSVLDYIPVIYHYGIWNRTNVTDLADYVEAAIQSERFVDFPPGQYRLGRAVNRPESECHLRGAGQFATDIDIVSFDDDGIVLGNGSDLRTYFSVTGMRFTSSVLRTGGVALTIDKGFMVEVTDLVIEKQALALSLQTCINTTVDRVHVLAPVEGGRAVEVNGGNDTHLRRMYLQADTGLNAGVAVDVKFSAYITLDNVTALGDWEVGIDLHPREAGAYIDWVFMTNCCGDTCREFGIRIWCEGAALSIKGVQMLGCWGSTCDVGLVVDCTGTGYVDGITATNFRALTNRKEGIKFATGANVRNIHLVAPIVAGNSTGAPGTYDGIYVAGGLSGFSCLGGACGLYVGFAATQRAGIYFDTGASDVITVIGTNVTNNMSYGIRDLASGGNKYFAGCPGFLNRSAGVVTMTSGTTTKVVTHGLSVAPTTVLVTPRADPGGRFWVSSIGASTFTINSSTAPGADCAYGWRVEF